MTFNPGRPTKYKGTDKYIAFFVTRNRLPTGADYRQPETGTLYSVGTVWQVGKDPTTGSEGDLYMLSKIVANVAYWSKLSDGDVAFDSFQVQAVTAPGVNPVTADINGLVTVNGAAVANHSVVLETRSRALNAFNLEVQYATTAAATDGTKSGVAHFDSAAFDVDANGFVQLNGGGIAATSFNVQANTVPGTDPVVPTALGVVTVNGAVVANHSVVLETRSRAANTYNLEVQYAAAVAATDGTKSGVCHFDSTKFAVDASGFVTSLSTDLHVAKFIVGDISNGANYSTIAAALAAATSGSTIAFQPGVYNEDLNWKAGVNATAFVSESYTPNVTIKGKITASYSGSASFSGIRFETDGDYFLEVSGSNATVLTMTNCFFKLTNNTGISYTTSSGSSFVRINYTWGSLDTTGITYFVKTSPGILWIDYSNLTNDVNSVTPSTDSAGLTSIGFSRFMVPFSNSGTARFVSRQANYNQFGLNTTILTLDGTPAADHECANCRFDGGTAAAISVGAGSNATFTNCQAESTNATSAVTGAGTIRWNNFFFPGTQYTIDTTTQECHGISNDNIVVKIPSSYPYTVVAQDALVSVDTSSAANTINLIASPKKGARTIIKDASANAAANNITVQGNGNNIVGSASAASFTMSTNGQSIMVVYNGTNWLIV